MAVETIARNNPEETLEMATQSIIDLTPEIEVQQTDPPDWRDGPSHKAIEREDWPQEWEDEYSELFPEFPAPEPKGGLKTYKGYAPMSRDQILMKSDAIRARPFLFYLRLYQWARPIGRQRGLVITSRKELADAVGRHVRTVDDDLKTLSMGFIEILKSAKGRPRGGRGHSRDPGRLVIRILKYQSAEEAGNDRP